MEELIGEINETIRRVEHSIERSRRYQLLFTSVSAQYYQLIILTNALETWETILKMVLRYKTNRCAPIEKKSDFYQKTIDMQRNGVPGFVTKETYVSMINYMKQMEWVIDSLNGSWGSTTDKK